MTFSRQGHTPPCPDALICSLDQACQQHSCRAIFIAEDREGRHHAAVYLVWDHNTACYLMGGGDPQLRNSGAASLCMWEAIQYAAAVTKQFDFKGSMIEPIERYFRAFGAVQVPYFSISKTQSRILLASQALAALMSTK